MQFLPRMQKINLPEVALIGATRGMLGLGAGLLAAPLMRKSTRKTLGTILVAAGALATVPLALRMIQRLRADEDRIVPDLDTRDQPGKPISREKPSRVMH